MPRLPDSNSLGGRPIPSARRTVATQRNRGGVADAAGQFGANVAQVAGQALEKQDKVNYATAKGKLLQELTAAQTELENDPDYGTLTARFDARAVKVREEAAKLIKSRSDRAMFEADAGALIFSAQADVKKLAWGKEVKTLQAGADTFAEEQMDLAANAPTGEARAATLGNYGTYIDGLVQKGVFDPVEGAKRKRAFNGDSMFQRVQSLATQERWDEADKAFRDNLKFFTADQEVALEKVLRGGMERRLAFERADDALTFTIPVAAVVPSEPGQPRTLKPGESARVLKVGGAAGTVASVLSGGGMSAPVVAGFLGNLKHENNFRHDGGVGDGGTAFGIAQWRNERVVNFRKVIGVDVQRSTLAQQAQFINWEMANPKAAGMTVVQRDAILAAKTPEEAARLIDKHYERSDGKTREVRAKSAREFAGGTYQGEAGVSDVPDLGIAYERLEARAEAEQWSPEALERAKEQVSVEINRRKAVENQRRDDAYESAYARAETLGDRFTDVSQLGPSFDEASPEQRRSLRNMAEANLKAAQGDGDVDPDGRMATALEIMAIEQPERFTDPKHDLRQYAGKIDKSKLNALLVKQARMKQGDDESKSKEERLRSGITGAINWMNDYGGVKVSGDDKVRAFNWMESHLRDVLAKKGTLQQSDYTEAMRLAVKVDAGSDRRYYQLLSDIPKTFRDDFVRQWRGPRAPSEAQIISAWRNRVVTK